MVYLFCRIGWMKYYQGVTEDLIIGGGSYVRDRNTGFEVCNFRAYYNTYYGFVGIPSDKTININRLGAKDDDDSISNITVIWTAKHPAPGKEAVIVGWYQNATVYRAYQEFGDKRSALHRDNDIDGYRITTLEQNAVLLPIYERNVDIPKGKGGMGQSNIWYADTQRGKLFIKKEVEPLIRGSKTSGNKRARNTDPEKNARVEKAAIDEVTRYFKKNGYPIVNSVEADNKGWDLEAITKKGKMLCVEVKGLSGNMLTVELTPNEYKTLNEKNTNYRLCIVCEALTDPRLFICQYNSSLKKENKWIVERVIKNKAVKDKKASVKIKPKTGAVIKILST